MADYVEVDMPKLLYAFAYELNETPGLQKIMDDRGKVYIPIDRYGDFCHDIGVILGQTLMKIVEGYE